MRSIKLVVAVPTAGVVPMAFAYSLVGMFIHANTHGIASLPDVDVHITLDVVESSNWILNREQLVVRAIKAENTHLMFLDDDMTFDPEILGVLLGRDVPIITTNYLMKTDAPEFVAMGLDGKRVPTYSESTGVEKIAYSGFGVSIFDLEVFKKTPQPWFLPDFQPETSQYSTEDNPFFRRARESGFDVLLDHDASKLVGHMGRRLWNWKEFRRPV